MLHRKLEASNTRAKYSAIPDILAFLWAGVWWGCQVTPGQRNPTANRQVHGDVVPEYRCYHVDMGDHIVDFELFEVSTDAEACSIADRIATRNRWGKHELWQLGRRVYCGGTTWVLSWPPSLCWWILLARERRKGQV